MVHLSAARPKGALVAVLVLAAGGFGGVFGAWCAHVLGFAFVSADGVLLTVGGALLAALLAIMIRSAAGPQAGR